MDYSGRYFDALAKVPRMRGHLRRDRNWSRAFTLGDDLPADAAGGPVHNVIVIPCRKTYPPLHRDDLRNASKEHANRYLRIP